MSHRALWAVRSAWRQATSGFIYVCVVRAAMLGAVTIQPIATRRSTFTQPDTLLSKATIRPKDGAGATLTKSGCCTITSEVIHASPVLADISRLSLGCVRAK